MKIKVNREDFLKNLQMVLSASSKANIMSVLSNVLIQAKDKKVTLTANNQLIQIKSYFIIEDEQEFNITVNANLLNKMLLVFNAREINLEYVENSETQKSWITMSHGKTNYKINAIKSEEYKFFEYSKNNLKTEGQVAYGLLSKKNKRSQTLLQSRLA